MNKYIVMFLVVCTSVRYLFGDPASGNWRDNYATAIIYFTNSISVGATTNAAIHKLGTPDDIYTLSPSKYIWSYHLLNPNYLTMMQNPRIGGGSLTVNSGVIQRVGFSYVQVPEGFPMWDRWQTRMGVFADLTILSTNSAAFLSKVSVSPSHADHTADLVASLCLIVFTARENGVSRGESIKCKREWPIFTVLDDHVDELKSINWEEQAEGVDIEAVIRSLRLYRARTLRSGTSGNQN